MVTPLEVLAGLWLSVWPAAAVATAPAPAAPAPAIAHAPARPSDSPASLLSLTDDELMQRIESDAASLGSLSIGGPGRGRLFNGVALPADSLWEIVRTAETWATSETIDAIRVAVGTVNELFPDTPPIFIGDMSGPDGGRLKRHESHQTGRDVDFGFYYKENRRTWYSPGTAANLDLARNWAFVRALLVRTDVQAVFLDGRIQRLLYKYALSIGEDAGWLDRVFQYPRGSAGAIVKHLKGHRTHYHVRFYAPIAQELGRRAYPLMVQLGIIDPPVYTVRHVVRRGQTLGLIAARYGTTVDAIMRANRMRSSQLRVGRAYRVPVRAAVAIDQPVVVPRRILPPQTPQLLASVDWPTAESLYGDDSHH